MDKNKHETLKDQYLPRARTGYSPNKEDLVSHSPEGVNTPLPNTVTDDIVVNNIAYSEFDYTEQDYIDSDLNTNA